MSTSKSDHFETVENLTGGNKPPRTVKQPGMVSAGTRHARELFLYGNGDGKPVTGTARLAELSGVSTTTIERWRGVWERERKAIALAETGGKRDLIGTVTAESVQWQADQTAVLKQEAERLKKVLGKLTAGSEAHNAALRLYTATIKAWESSSGFAAYAETSAAYAKELARTAARQRGNSDAVPKLVSGFDFAISESQIEK